MSDEEIRCAVGGCERVIEPQGGAIMGDSKGNCWIICVPCERTGDVHTGDLVGEPVIVGVA